MRQERSAMRCMTSQWNVRGQFFYYIIVYYYTQIDKNISLKNGKVSLLVSKLHLMALSSA